MKTMFSFGSISPKQLAEMCDTTTIYGNTASVSVCGICTDSREADADTVFCALRGERVDGHDYIETACERGCRVILCEEYREPIAAAGAVAIVVKDCENALAKLAFQYMETLQAKSIAVTGSVGKTTTKDMIASVLSVRYEAFKTKGNFNSVIGMPLSMLEIPKACEYSVLEMGMSGFGEIERLSLIAQPDIAVITTIGTSHMEMLGSRENICRAKLEVLCGLKQDGILLLNGDEPLLANVNGKSYKTLYISTERENAHFFAKNIRVEADCTRFDIAYNGCLTEDLCVRVVGRHNVYSALFAFAVGVLSGMTAEEIREGLLRFAPENLRQNIVSFAGMTFMEDCYNASPESMQAAIDVLDAYHKLKGGRTVAVLGDMLELGEESSALHRQVGAHLAKKSVDRLITLGKGGSFIAVGAMQCGMKADRIDNFPYYEDVIEEIGAHLVSTLQKGDAVLFKASRAVGIERLIDYLQKNMKA
ncbi:MAG: UDP-N-acetylmuramoyl-tripeptide--D-alanyl-D-alanine ligase [Clostridia bacterium]|nr:UDP-N-acetylmuramoyl-tripeptide--D-alanyl-D-alanine ligase [Clostridia bacterium]